jgi:hypothetical protein
VLERAVGAVDIFDAEAKNKLIANSTKLISRYPLLTVVMSGFRYGHFDRYTDAVVDYINMIDERVKP